MTAPIDISFATGAASASHATGAGHTDPSKAPAGSDKFGDIFSNLTHHSGTGAADKDAKAGARAHPKADAEAEADAEAATQDASGATAGEKTAEKSAASRDAAAFGRLLQRWASGEKTAAESQDGPAGQKAPAKGGTATPGHAPAEPADGPADPQAETKAETKASRAAQAGEAARIADPARQQEAADRVQASLADLSTEAEGELAPPKAARPHGAEGGAPARTASDEAAREALTEAADTLADALGKAGKASAEADRPAPGKAEKAEEGKHRDAPAPQPSAAADTVATPAASLSTLVGALQQQVAAKDAKAGAGSERSAPGGADGRSDARTAPADDDQVNHIQVKVTRRETHFAPVLNLDQRQAAANAGAKATAQNAAAREFAAAEAAARSGAAAGTEAAAKAETDGARTQTSRTGTADSAAATGGERAAAPGAGLPGATSATGFGSLTSLPFATAAQVSRAITEEAARMQSGQPPGPQATAQGPVRILEMTVTPESLGRVVIHMRLTANGLEVRVRAAEAGTAQMLAQDHDALVRIIEASGTKVDHLDVVRSITSPVEASIRPAFTAAQSSNSNAEQDSPQRREQGRGGDNPGRGQADDDAQSRSRRSSDSSDD